MQRSGEPQTNMRKRTILLILLIGSTAAALRESYSTPQAPAALESRIRDPEGQVSMLQSQLSAQNAMLRILMQDYEERKRHQR
jgi:hypothetical protein